MAASFPHQYRVDVDWQADRRGALSAPPRPALTGGPPPEFDGSAEWWSPEHLLLSAVSLCQMTTFLALAAKARLRVLGYHARAEGTLDRTESGIVFTRIVLNIELRVPEDERGRAEQLAHAAHRHCIVSNSLKTPVGLEIAVNAG